MTDAPTQIVATYQNLLIVRGDDVLANLSEPGVGHYGVTWNRTHLFALFGDVTALDGSHQMIRVFDRELKPVRDILAGEIGGVHQIAWHDGSLWVTSTNTDAVVIADEMGNVRKVWHPADDEAHPGRHHINSIWFEDDHVYTLAHGLLEGEPAVYCHSYPRLKPINKVRIARGAHNIFWDIYLVNGGIYRVGQAPVWLSGMMKGLSVTADRVYIGSSQIIEDRQRRRADSSGVIWELSRALEVLGKRELDAGPVNEIRTLDRPDLAHHGQPWSGKWGI